MKSLSRSELRDLLAVEGFTAAAGSLEGGGDPNEPASPWFVRGLVAFGAWFAGVMTACGLVAGLSIQNSGTAIFTAGLLVCGLACGLRRAGQRDFTVQLSLALSVAGQGMVAAGLLDHGSHLRLLGVMLVLELGLVVVFRDTLHRFFSTAAAGVFLWLLLWDFNLEWLGPLAIGGGLAGWWLIPPSAWTPGTAPYRRPVMFGLAAAFCPLMWIFHHQPHSAVLNLGRVVAAAVPGALLGAASLRVLGRLGVRLVSLPGAALLAAWATLALAGVWAPGVPGMLFVVVVALEARERVLGILAWAAGGIFLSVFYYDLATSLLAKSGLLLASGAVLLAARFALTRKEARC